ncbi:MAG: N-glycosylase/DNA lyase [Nitrospirota bacterium]
MRANVSDEAVARLKDLYRRNQDAIINRIHEFEHVWKKGSDVELFRELVFCLLTPQSKAKSCWEAVTNICRDDLLVSGGPDQVKTRLRSVRFHNKKSMYVVKARDVFMQNGRLSVRNLLADFSDVFQLRDWLVTNIKGMGYKEASHFLRNIGLGNDIAILDRHILRNLHRFGVIDRMPDSLTRTRYLDIEDKMREFSERIAIPLAHLDLLLWFKETGEIFK